LFVLPPRTLSFCTSAITSMVLPEVPRSESCQVALHSPSCGHALVKTALSVWRGRRRRENATALFRVTLDGGLGSPTAFLRCPPQRLVMERARFGKVKIFHFWQRSECCNLLGRAFDSRRDLHWPCRVRAITTRNKSGRDTVVATNRVCARAGPAGRLPDLARYFSGVRFSLPLGRPIALRVWLRRGQYSPRCVCRDMAD